MAQNGWSAFLTDCLLVGAGQHARVVAEILTLNGDRIVAYSDLKPQTWISAPHLTEQDWSNQVTSGTFVLGLGGVTPAQLLHRRLLMEKCKSLGLVALSRCHPTASISQDANVAQGALVFAGAVVNVGASLGEGVILNSAAIIEHDCAIGAGSHIAPGAIILGGAKIGSCCMIGAGSVILPNTTVPDNAMVAALTRGLIT
ncbi:MAG: hypothetical protein CMM78_06765 [Rhodospirillaceae bacterium]|jgi:sugar O-acyltransferase (sialic acid O-acetyltransferase NeuD family)|nr:hypothetical protein [Rhodospirillales bacterium]MAX47895.1 hypothetical protein [Rhodospirillaceae bacterium]|tara:strand:- start:194227 stop:194826 length:600 start_codon:yes stop_codon:yes gene_type:complete